MCPRCGFVAGREKNGCNQIICPKPCSQAFCFKCSKDWKLCKGICKGGAAEVLERATEEERQDSPVLEEDKSEGRALVVEDEDIEDEETEEEATKKKRTHSPDPLFERFAKKTKIEIIEDEEDENDPELDLDVSDDEDDDAGFGIEEDEYGYDDGEEGDDDGEDEQEDELEDFE
jgi:hypothetical protein